jgi:CheY-like chemotaxis protein
MAENIADAPVTVRKTLVVEDDRVARLALTKILESLGREVETAATLAEGLSKTTAEVQCMLLDLVLPDGDGIEILRQVRSQSLPIRVAVTTGVSDPDLLAAIYALNPDAVFHKPLHLPDIARWLLRPE